ncbi:uncharacterized protein LOC111621339 [Centruroides sculpturatus]|uniref:uncharacterized protein LOC111621339 n=1 Tax=Centruroides sculpturatus TaxID=218467 RepID=UPI000C6EA8CB|nr:uncharacterized protein LOC111621339 [Centruroides sculpturatus]
MLNKIKLFSTNHVQEAVLNILGRIGIFCEEELEDFPSLLRRFGCIHFSFGDKSILQCSSSSISVSDFTHRIIHYSLEQNIPNFLYYFLNENLYSTESLLHCLFCSTPLLGMISSFSKWSKMPDERNIFYCGFRKIESYLLPINKCQVNHPERHAPITMGRHLLLWSSKDNTSLDEPFGDICLTDLDPRMWRQVGNRSGHRCRC